MYIGRWVLILSVSVTQMFTNGVKIVFQKVQEYLEACNQLNQLHQFTIMRANIYGIIPSIEEFNEEKKSLWLRWDVCLQEGQF